MIRVVRRSDHPIRVDFRVIQILHSAELQRIVMEDGQPASQPASLLLRAENLPVSQASTKVPQKLQQKGDGRAATVS